MRNFNRREFLALGGKFAALMGLGSTAVPGLAQALEQLAGNTKPVLWLQGQSCSGCSVSLLNSEDPGPVSLITEYMSLLFHQTLSTATGHVAMDVVKKSIKKGGYLLVVEGSISAGMPEACMMGHESIVDLVKKASENATAIAAVGTCAAFGGIPAAENNPTGAVSVPQFIKKENINKPVIALPGCPVHPDWLVGTLAYLVKFGIPPLDGKGRPKMFYSKLIHDQCPRFPEYERENFAKSFSDDGCLFKLGCVGTNTHADCTLRYWNSRINSCIPAGGPCIGCASEEFALKASFPFYRKNEKLGIKED